MKHRLTMPILAVALVFPAIAGAQDSTLVISDAVAPETPPSAMTGAGYMTITNTGNTDQRLIAVAADFPRVMMHETQMQDGVATMQHQNEVTIPAGATVSFAPGGRHIMFMGLNGDPFEIGERIPLTLTFDPAGEVVVMLDVVSRETLVNAD